MKFSVATVLALATAVFGLPIITNTNFSEIEEGKPFTITWADAEGPVTITLKTGPEDHLTTVQVIESGITGDSYTWTPEDLPSGTYAFQINDSGPKPNYSKQFPYTGTGAPLSSASGTVSSTASSSVTSASSKASSSDSTITSSASESTGSSSITTSTSKTSTSTRAPANTVVNNNPSEGQRFSSPLALLLVTVAGVIFFN